MARVAVPLSTLLGTGLACGGAAPRPLMLSPTAMTFQCSGPSTVSTGKSLFKSTAAVVICMCHYDMLVLYE